MRPAGEIRIALMNAAKALCYRDDQGRRRGPTLAEMAERACVAIGAARRTVDNMGRAGDLEMVFERKVEYRNRPVAEYAPSEPSVNASRSDVDRVMAAWVNR